MVEFSKCITGTEQVASIFKTNGKSTLGQRKQAQDKIHHHPDKDRVSVSTFAGLCFKAKAAEH